MEQIGMFDAKTRFSELVDRVNQTGQAITVTNRGKPVAELCPIRQAAAAESLRQDAVVRVAQMWDEEPVVSQEQIREMLNEGRDRCLDV